MAMLALAACGAEGAGTTSLPDDTTTIASTTTTPDAITTTEPLMADEQQMIDDAKKDLSRKLLMPTDAIEVVEFREVEWPDGAMGCPEEGQVYTQAIVEGSQVLLRADGRIYDYHAGSDDVVFLCSSEEKDGGYDFVPPPGYDR